MQLKTSILFLFMIILAFLLIFNTTNATEYGSEYVFNSGVTDTDAERSNSFLDSTHFVVAYRDFDNDGYGTCVIGTVTGNTISYGNEYVFYSGSTYNPSVSAFDSTHFVVSYTDHSTDYGTCVIGTVTGNTISYGSKYVFNYGNTEYTTESPLDSTHFVVAYSDIDNSSYGTCVIGAVTGSSISYGSEYVFSTDDTEHISISSINSTHFVVAYSDHYAGTACIGAVTGSSISYGSEYVFNSATTLATSISSINSTHFIISYKDRGLIIGVISGSTISYGPEYILDTDYSYYNSVSILDSTHFVTAFEDNDHSAGTNYGATTVGTFSGVNISCNSKYIFNHATTTMTSVSSINSTHFVVTYVDNGNDYYGTAIIGSSLITSTHSLANVEEVTATFSGDSICDEDMTCGFWYNTSSTSSTNPGNNVTCSGTYDSGETFTKSISGLTSGEYYYVRAWSQTGAGFLNDTTERYFLTKPNNPTALTVTSINATNMTLSWSNATVGDGTNQTSVLVYSTTGYPTTVGSGTIAYNGTAESYKLEGMAIATTYYFSLWAYINASGSPYYWWFSDSYDTESDTTEGGLYNVTFRWECNQTLINAATTDFQNSTLTAETIDGEILYINSSLTSNPTQIALEYNPDIIRFNYNDSGMIRSIIPVLGTQNYTIYVCCYPEWDGIDEFNLSKYQIFYTFAFTDYTPQNGFSLSNSTQLDIYKYNETGKFYVHQDYWSAEGNVKVALHYGERFYLGVKCPTQTISFLQYIDTLTDTLLEIDIKPTAGDFHNIYDFIAVNTSRLSNGLWINYTDASFSTISVNVSIYHVYPNNDTQVLQYQYNFTSNTYEYLWNVANGFNNTYSYKILMNIDIGEVSESDIYTAFSIPFLYSPAIDPSWFNNLFNQYVMNIETPIGISASQMVLLFLSFLFLIGLGSKWAFAGLISSGIIMSVGFSLLFNEGTVVSFGGIVLGITFIALGVLFARSDFIERGAT